MPALLALLLAAAPVHPAEEIVPRAIAAEDAPVPVRFGWKPGLALAVEVEFLLTRLEDGREVRTLRRRVAYDLEVAKAGSGVEVRATGYRELDPQGPTLSDVPPFGRPRLTLGADGALVGIDAAALDAAARERLPPGVPDDDLAVSAVALAARRIEAGARRLHALLVGRWVVAPWRPNEPVDASFDADAPPGVGGTVRWTTTAELAGRVPCRPGGAPRCVRLVWRQRRAAPVDAALAQGAGDERPPVTSERHESASVLVTDPDTLVPVEAEERVEQAYRVGDGPGAHRVEVRDVMRMTFRRR